jgi:hypothetical protein
VIPVTFRANEISTRHARSAKCLRGLSDNTRGLCLDGTTAEALYNHDQDLRKRANAQHTRQTTGTSKVTRLDYCHFLLVSQTNDTLAYFAEHPTGSSHAAVKRYLEDEKLTARRVWANVRKKRLHPNSSVAAAMLH